MSAQYGNSGAAGTAPADGAGYRRGTRRRSVCLDLKLTELEPSRLGLSCAVLSCLRVSVSVLV